MMNACRVGCMLLIAATALGSAGCKMLSTAAYACGEALDPSVRCCHDDVGNCSLCGETPADLQTVEQASYGSPPCGIGPGMEADPNFLGQFEQLRGESQAMRAEIDQLGAELRARNESLIQTRAELLRMQNEVASVRTNVNQWQQSVKDLHTQIQARDRERLSALHQMAASIERIVAENQSLRK